MTRRFSKLLLLALLGGLALRCSASADATNPAPDFKEVYDLLRANVPGATDGNLNRAAVDGLLAEFPGKVSLVADAADGSATPSGGTALDQCAVLESNVAYFRVNRVAGSLAGELGAAGRALTATNKVAGAILDLRFAGGDDYAAAQAAAGLWTAKKASRPVPGPLVVLANGGTSGTAEALITALRTAGAALVLGSPTAGSTMTFKTFVLKDGERLLIAVPPVKTDNQAVPAGGLRPDVAVAVSADEEREFWKNPYGLPAPGSNYPKPATNAYLPYIEHTSEADLVRERQKDGKLINAPGTAGPSRLREADDSGDDADGPASAASRPQRPVLRDPVLARAVDLVKGLAVVREARP